MSFTDFLREHNNAAAPCLNDDPPIYFPTTEPPYDTGDDLAFAKFFSPKNSFPQRIPANIVRRNMLAALAANAGFTLCECSDECTDFVRPPSSVFNTLARRQGAPTKPKRCKKHGLYCNRPLCKRLLRM